jgi:sRNA-binding carbon storage regulator CsrA
VKVHSVTAEGETVRLAIEAPKEIKVQRAETLKDKGRA